MKKINRFNIIFALWAIVLGWCAFVSVNPYLNEIVIFFAFLFVVCGIAYVDEHQNEKEEKFLNRLSRLFDED